MSYNQPSFCRPLLPTYEQATSASASTSILRLPDYRECHLARYSPYCRYEYHKRFDCRDDSPTYEAEAPNTRPSYRTKPIVYQVLEDDPEKRKIVRQRVRDFFDRLAMLVPKVVQTEEVETVTYDPTMSILA